MVIIYNIPYPDIKDKLIDILNVITQEINNNISTYENS